MRRRRHQGAAGLFPMIAIALCWLVLILAAQFTEQLQPLHDDEL